MLKYRFSILFFAILCSIPRAGCAQEFKASPKGQIEYLDSYNSTQKYIRLKNVREPGCDEGRFLLDHPDSAYRREMLAMAIAAFVSGPIVWLDYKIMQVNGKNQCIANRIFLAKE